MEKKRHGCLTAYLILAIVTVAVIGVSYSGIGNLTSHGSPVYAVDSLLKIAFLIAIWRWRKWGFWAIVVLDIIGGAYQAFAIDSFIPPVAAVLDILIMYGVLHIGGERQGWRQLE